ncbi:Hypothetical protein NTJ_10131 [Nesidiocoris tenuis]|uniref:Uncharacterized protein n=1 Tax=Nesidiocoris tenuis TaxID=355587 RepID=A0ABN7AYU1_9HEMI|nr:Hypothetical protein NTJ_10131 [Nesidiocoris tenuis]
MPRGVHHERRRPELVPVLPSLSLCRLFNEEFQLILSVLLVLSLLTSSSWQVKPMPDGEGSKSAAMFVLRGFRKRSDAFSFINLSD